MNTRRLFHKRKECAREICSFAFSLEARKRRYAALEAHQFAADVDYDKIFHQIDKELHDEYRCED